MVQWLAAAINWSDISTGHVQETINFEVLLIGKQHFEASSI